MAASAGIVCLFLGSGCSQETLPLAEVTGTVTWNGLPARAEVVFEPMLSETGSGGRPSSAFTEAGGTFKLYYAADRPGALIGEHRVLIKVLPLIEPGQEPTYQQAVAPLKTVRLERTVQAGTNQFDFPLTY